MQPRVLIVTPVHNEAAHIERVVAAVAAQSLPPARWVVVDDGSTDETLTILRSLQPTISFLELVEAPPASTVGSDRLAQAAEVRTFDVGLNAQDWRQYTHVMKLDGDVELAPDYFEVLLDRFAADPSLGLAGGVLVERETDGVMRRIVIPPYHVHGALKCYTRECFEAIGGIPQRLAWDTIDETYARMRGFRTRSFEDIVSRHLRPLASADGRLRGRARHGECAYIAHYGAAWIALRAVKVARFPPVGLSGVAFLYGYARAAVRRVPRVDDPEFRRFTRQELRRRMFRPLVPQFLSR